MVRIGNQLFSTWEEAEKWVEQGNISGTYSIIFLTFCVHCSDWQDTRRTLADDEVCMVCQRLPEDVNAPDTEFMERKEKDYEKLMKWNEANVR